MHRAVLLAVFLSTLLPADSPHYKWLRQIGGSGTDAVVGMGVDAAGNTYVVGNTDSPDFPTLNALQKQPGGLSFYRIDLATGAAAALTGNLPANAYSLAADPRDSRTVYAATGGGLSISHDAGSTWVRIAPPAGLQTGTVAVAPDETVYVSTSPRGVYQFDGANWIKLTDSISLDRLVVDPSIPTILYGRSSGSVARSEDGGLTWTLASSIVISSFALDPRNPGTVYAVGNTSYRSTDYGKTWTPMGSLPEANSYPRAILVDPVTPNRIAAVSALGVFLSRDGAKTWTNTTYRPGIAAAVDPATGTFYFEPILTNTGPALVSTRDFVTFTPVGPSNLPIPNALLIAGSSLYVSAGVVTDVTVSKLDADGNTVYSTYLGGSGQDTAVSMAVDALGAVYITGQTNSPNFPVTPGTYSSAHTASLWTFVSKLNPDGSLAWSSFFAGTAVGTYAKTLSLNADGSVYIAGTTSSGLPVTEGAYQHDFDAPPPVVSIGPVLQSTNAFVARLSPDGSRLIFSTYLPKQYEMEVSNAVAPDGSVYVGGGSKIWHISADGTHLLHTASSTQGGPLVLTVAPDGVVYALGRDDQLDKLTPALQTIQTRLLGATQTTSGRSVSVDAAGRVLLAGSTIDRSFPTHNPLQGVFAPSTGFVTQLTADLSVETFSTFVGDERIFSTSGAAATRDGDLVFAGSTGPPYTYYGRGIYQITTASDPWPDMFVAKLATPTPPVRLDRIVNAASYLANPLTPGEVVVVFGDGFGTNPRLLIEGRQAQILNASPQAFGAIVPADLPTSGSAHVQVLTGELSSNEVVMPVRPASPGIYYILNADGSRNTPDNPTSEGLAITVLVDGASNAAQPVNVFIDGFYANGIGAKVGALAGLGGDVYQVSVYIPKAADLVRQNPDLKNYKVPPVAPVQIEMGDVVSQKNAFVYVR